MTSVLDFSVRHTTGVKWRTRAVGQILMLAEIV
jgi:hypothetical protein